MINNHEKNSDSKEFRDQPKKKEQKCRIFIFGNTYNNCLFLTQFPLCWYWSRQKKNEQQKLCDYLCLVLLLSAQCPLSKQSYDSIWILFKYIFVFVHKMSTIMSIMFLYYHYALYNKYLMRFFSFFFFVSFIPFGSFACLLVWHTIC